MNEDIKQKWVKALRSGKYTQGKGRLKALSTDGTINHCCLGVLVEEIHPEYFQVFGDNQYIGEDYSMTSLSDEIVNEAQMCDDEQGRLINMNDQLGKTFKQIANYIDKNL